MLNISDEEKQALLNQHSRPYDGYQTLRFPEPDNRIYTYDSAGDKGGVTINNKGEVKPYTNVGINESVAEPHYGAFDYVENEMIEGEVDEYFYFDVSDEGIENEEEKRQKRKDDLNSALSIFGKKEDDDEYKELSMYNPYYDNEEGSNFDFDDDDENKLDESERMCECGGMYNENVCEVCGGSYMGVNEDITEPYSEIDFSNYDFDSKGPEQFKDENMDNNEELFPSYDSDGNFLGMGKSSGDMELDGEEMYPNEKPAYEFDSPGPYGSTNTFEGVENPEKVKQSIKESLNWFKRFSKFN
jgi:hypothetical protein